MGRQTSFRGGGGSHPPSLGQMQSRLQREPCRRESMEEEGVLYTVRVMVGISCVFGVLLPLQDNE
jgi:hypothetical protein